MLFRSVNYYIPRTPQDYIHRIGLTVRATKRGTAISLVSQDEKRYLQAIEKWLNQKISVETVDGYTEDNDVPDFVLLRPNSRASEEKADRDIKQVVARRIADKKRKKARMAKSKGTGKTMRPKSKSRPENKPVHTGKKRSKSGSRSPKASIKNKSRANR